MPRSRRDTRPSRTPACSSGSRSNRPRTPSSWAPRCSCGRRRREGWPIYKPIDDTGRFVHPAPEFVHGRFVKEADPHIVEDLQTRGVLLRAETFEHSYPFCWRCATPLLYLARTSWYLTTTSVKDRL